MRLVGIAAEYNPFHKGHMYHIERARQETAADGVCVILSGSFAQRGEPCIFDKWTRARHALLGGADLVLELPAVYALSSAEGFARGAVETLRATGVVDTLSFGSECGDVELLKKMSHSETQQFRARLKDNLKKGKSYAAAYAAAYEENEKQFTPNNILAMEYLRFLGTDIKAHTIQRVGTSYTETAIDSAFPSALGLRKKLEKGEDCSRFMPFAATCSVHRLENYETLILYALRTADLAQFMQIPKVVRARLEKCDKTSLTSILETAKTRNITKAAIKRALLQILLQNHVSPSTMPSYIRVLGFTNCGASALKEMKKKASLPVITRPAAFREKSEIWETEKRATDIYFMPEGVAPSQDIRRAPVTFGNHAEH